MLLTLDVSHAHAPAIAVSDLLSNLMKFTSGLE